MWIADFDAATGATSNAKKLTAIATEADNAKWAPDGKSIVFTSTVYPDCPAISAADFDTGNKCNAERDAVLAASKVKAQIWTHLFIATGTTTRERSGRICFWFRLTAAGCAI